jgi:hypothetical protein
MVYDVAVWSESTRAIHYGPEFQYPEWATSGDKHMFGIGERRVMNEEEFVTYLHVGDESGVYVLEQKRYEECSEAPGPDNEVVVGAALAVWTDRAIATIKNHGKGLCPQAFAASQLCRVVNELPTQGAWVRLLVESADVLYAFRHGFDRMSRGESREEYTSMEQWQALMGKIGEKRVAVEAREFHEYQDAEFTKMRMAGICEAQEMMEAGVADRSNPTSFLA